MVSWEGGGKEARNLVGMARIWWQRKSELPSLPQTPCPKRKPAGGLPEWGIFHAGGGLLFHFRENPSHSREEDGKKLGNKKQKGRWIAPSALDFNWRSGREKRRSPVAASIRQKPNADNGLAR